MGVDCFYYLSFTHMVWRHGDLGDIPEQVGLKPEMPRWRWYDVESSAVRC